jgi:hypothetical protein
LYGEQLVEAGGRFIDVSLLEKSIGLRGIGEKRTKTAEKSEGKNKADAGRRYRRGHG